MADDAARALLDAEIAPGVADRLLDTAAGNPLALLEIPALLSAGQLAGREPLEDPLRPGTGVERAFAAAVAALPEPARRALLVAAAADTRRLDAIGRGLAEAGLSLADLEPAEAARVAALSGGERHMIRRGMCSAMVPQRGDLVEACVRAGRRDEAQAALARMDAEPATGARLPAAIAARCRGLLAADADFRAAFAAAPAIHAGLPMPFERARTELALGERLRRARQRAEAREPLTAALDAFERLGARPWAERARAELRATGGPAAKPGARVAAEQLTPHELQIALLVAQGMTNREAAAACSSRRRRSSTTSARSIASSTSAAARSWRG